MINKTRKWIIRISVALTAVFCACGAAACGAPKQLDMPENLQLEGRMLTWDEVEDADGYAVYVDDQEYIVEDNAFEIPFLAGPKTYQVEVMALGDWKKTKDSEWGEIEYIREAPVEEGVQDGFHLSLLEDMASYEVVGCDNRKGYLIFPDTFNDYPITKIADRLFAPPGEWMRSVNPYTGYLCNVVTTGVKLPCYLEIIGVEAFEFCFNLQEVIIPDSVKVIGDCAFRWCQKVKKIEIPSSLREVGIMAFTWSLGDMEELIFPDGMESIGESAFWNGEERTYKSHNAIPALRKVVIPRSIKHIGDRAFFSNENLIEIAVPTDNIETFGWQIFHYTAWYDNQPEGLVYVDKVLYGYKGDMPENYKLIVNADVLGIAGWAFCEERKLEEVWLADGVKLLGERTFDTCTSLTRVRLPADLTCIPAYTFYKTRIQELEIPKSVKEIGVATFYYSSLKRLILEAKCKLESTFSKPFNVLYQGVEYVYSLEKPTEIGDYWHIDEDGYFAIWE